MTYREALAYLESFINYEKIPAYPYRQSFKLERAHEFLGLIGNPHNDLKYVIHVAGSKGKGSTCAFCAYILREAGLSVGLYTSPHLSDFRERIRILRPSSRRGCGAAGLRVGGPAGRRRKGGKNFSAQDDDPAFEGMIPADDLVALVGKLKPEVEKFTQQSVYGTLSFFEIYTALALLYFSRRRVDAAVIETGLGGRLDATNSMRAPVCVITPIGLEHTQILGNTPAEIADEKAGIIKETTISVICAPQEKAAHDSIAARCRLTGARLYEVGRDITFERGKDGIRITTPWNTCEGLTIPLAGDHQLVNAACAAGAVGALSARGINVAGAAMRAGIARTLWPGRCEVVSRNPLVILDGAQTAASARALIDTLKKYFSYEHLVLVFGISGDKDIRGVCMELAPAADTVIVTKSANPRAADPRMLRRLLASPRAGGGRRPRPVVTNTVAQALEIALRRARAGGAIVATGSLFVAGEAREAFRHMDKKSVL